MDIKNTNLPYSDKMNLKNVIPEAISLYHKNVVPEPISFDKDMVKYTYSVALTDC
jgi:hypothetical protein